MGPVLALLAAIAYGTADFLGGLGGRRIDPTSVSALSQSVAVVPAALALVVVESPSPSGGSLTWSLVAGAAGGVGNAALYRGLARGRMSIVAPVSAVTTAIVPAVVGLAGGDELSVVGWAGLVLALPSIVLVATSRATADRIAASIGWGGLAGAGFGVLFVGLDRAGTQSGAWPVLISQLVAAALVAGLAVPGYRRRRATPRRDPDAPAERSRADLLRFAIPAGVLSSGANLLFLAATGRGQLTVVSVLTALYPAVTVLFAAALLRDRPGRTQLVGLVLAAVAVALVVVGE